MEVHRGASLLILLIGALRRAAGWLTPWRRRGGEGPLGSGTREPRRPSGGPPVLTATAAAPLDDA